MKVIGFNFTKISASRQPTIEKIKNIQTKIEFLNIDKDKLEILKEGEVIKVNFKYSVIYEPKSADVVFEGNILLLVDQETSKEILKAWKKKTVDEKAKVALFNIIMGKCNLRALQLEDELNVPTHIRMPRVMAQKPQ